MMDLLWWQRSAKEARLALIRHMVDKAVSQGHLAAVDDDGFAVVAEKCEGYSLADVDSLVRRAFLQVVRELPSGVKAGLRPADVPPVTMQHFHAALQQSSGTSALRDMLKKRRKTRSQL